MTDPRIDAIRERLVRFTASVEAYGAVTKSNSDELYATAASDIAHLLIELEQVSASEARLREALRAVMHVDHLGTHSPNCHRCQQARDAFWNDPPVGVASEGGSMSRGGVT